MIPAHEITILGETTGRPPSRRFGIKQADRTSHLWVIGKTGAGKSTLLGQIAAQDLAAGRGFALIDPHGDLVETIARAVPASLAHRVRYLNVPDAIQPYGYNPLRRVPDQKIPLAASGLLEALKKLWPDAWGVRMEHLLRSTLFALLERDGSTLPDILKLYANDGFRAQVVRRLRNQTVRRFWTAEFEKYPWRYRAEAVAPIQNKLGALLSDPTLYRILVEPKIDLRLRRLMDEGGVLLVNLSKGHLGGDSASTLGGLLVATIGLAAMSRAEMPVQYRRPFTLIVDEFQSFTTLAFVGMLAELRKSGVAIALANQHMAQLDPEVRQAALGNVATLISFRVGSDDAAVLAREFQPIFNVEDLLNLPNRAFYVKLMIDGTPSRPFSGRTVPTGQMMAGAAEEQ